MSAMQNQRVFIQDLANGMAVDQVFVVRQKELRTTKGGDLYISATLGDATGSIPARMWQASEAVFNDIAVEGFLHIKGRVEDYRGSLQLMIDACRPWPADKVNASDFMPVSPHDIEEMWSELLELLRAIKNKSLRMLIKKFLEDQQIVTAFKRSAAAVQMHQPYIGGLLEHTLNVTKAAKALLPMYPQLNADLVYAGAFLHDIAKCAEMASGLTVHYTDRGQLVGHLTMACIWVQQKAKQVADETGEAFPKQIVNLLQHLILSHHGEHQFGSPKLPAIPEAFFLHYLDNLDAKMWMTANAIASDPDRDSDFTNYMRALETRLYKRSNSLTDADDDEAAGMLFE
jgi:3'-5' exoribonuclease